MTMERFVLFRLLMLGFVVDNIKWIGANLVLRVNVLDKLCDEVLL